MSEHEQIADVLAKCLPVGDCLEFQGSRDSKGYGRIGHRERAHRTAWASVNGAIPDGMQVCHVCDNPPCCNPDHLFLGTPQDNYRDRQAKGRTRGLVPGGGRHLWTHCKRGHEFTDENTRIDTKGRRLCRTCLRMHDQANKARLKRLRAAARLEMKGA